MRVYTEEEPLAIDPAPDCVAGCVPGHKYLYVMLAVVAKQCDVICFHCVVKDPGPSVQSSWLRVQACLMTSESASLSSPPENCMSSIASVLSSYFSSYLPLADRSGRAV
jgi:hypothetical protein